ncbi:ShlB/FhaC/HecB family hemolysin secretion/activation protein [Geoalkalibacter halelectricus]|uniref:ShlB/FhaC/HecB family hemolysin secretion/activation protein n=2 Tax=Geoalkalibacter halelectricus TaxID=2847045 RepID=A0ABY5ZH69_9BACT|nr:ShlB/FhaC/HecB family hemolysin secretion/activation protein [Geoalkalibacter halelectricus]UWZ78234.1 ShlB/FhaC/HecB family hemolysin secretion/activation protein [Geoalkalibacter halelectricus]
MISTLRVFAVLAIFVVAQPAFSQIAPDAGRILQELQTPPTLPAPSDGLVIEPPTRDPVAPGGPKAEVRNIEFSGHSVFSDEQLTDIVADRLGQEYDLAGMRDIAWQVTSYYQQNGYPFARAFLPAQTLTDGTLKIEIVEGRYGQVLVQGEERVAATAQRWLEGLQPGEVIASAPLERTTLLLDDLPGIRTAPLIRPGQELGTGDLLVTVEPDRRYSGDVAVDNHGNRYTGEYRARLGLNLNPLVRVGDQLQLRTMVTNETLLLGSATYSVPVGYSGLRAQVGYAHTDYELGKEFSVAESTGTAQITSAGLSYPLVRSQRTNLTAGILYQHKRLTDKDLTGRTRRTSDSVPISLLFDHRDGFLGAGITYGSLAWTQGRVKFNDSVADRPQGNFHKVNIDVARLQQLTDSWTFFARVSGQKSDSNLDSSEDFGVGGVYGVRAYPSGEGYGDQGILTQMELRYRIQRVSPYLFYDFGHVRINKFSEQTDNHRRIDGAGVGLRADYRGFSTDIALAWRTRGGEPLSDSKDRDPRLWATFGYRF